jgi:N-carbamoyl-L-amino-acid hydrolase
MSTAAALDIDDATIDLSDSAVTKELAKIEYRQAAVEYGQRLYGKDYLNRHFGEKGKDCLGYSARETQAIVVMMREAEAMGMEIYQDLAGNIHMIYRGGAPEQQALQFMSHLDAVPEGGQFDGTAGLVSAMAALHMLHKKGFKPPQDVCITICRHEESPNFQFFGLGSALMTGLAPPEVLSRLNKAGQRLVDMIASVRFGTNTQRLTDIIELILKVESRSWLIPSKRFFGAGEGHIEQAPVLNNAKTLLGFVDGIRGNIRLFLEYWGIAQHTGGGKMLDRADTSNMHNDLIVDVVPQLKRLIQPSYTQFRGRFFKVAAKVTSIFRKPHDLVYSFPLHKQENDNPTTTPNHTKVFFEARSLSKATLDRVLGLLQSSIDDIHKHYSPQAHRPDVAPGTKVGAELSLLSRTDPVMLDPALRKSLFQIVDDFKKEGFNVTATIVSSGAGHDIMRFAKSIKSFLMFFAHSGLSHNPAEDLDIHNPNGSFAAGTVLMARFMMGKVKGEVFSTTTGEALMEHGARRLQFAPSGEVLAL